MIKLFSDDMMKAICNAIVFSFAVGILLAIVTGVIVLSTRRSSARIRYNLLVASLATFTVTVLINLVQQLLEINSTNILTQGPIGSIDQQNIYTTSTNSTDSSAGVLSFLYTHANTIVLFWSFIVVVKLFRLMTGLQSLSILKKKDTSPLGQELQSLLNTIAEKLGIKRVVQVAASGIAKVPMVIGHLKPIILLPIELITSLSADHIEAILVHELAHIRRRDWLVNLLLVALEIIFFFNPAVLWIAALIRNERENCCDDIAVAYAGSTRDYIDTLVACEEYKIASSKYGIAFTGRKKPLLERVKRMISNKNTSLTQAERGIMAISLLLAFVGLIAFPAKTQNRNTAKQSLAVPSLIDSLQGNIPNYYTVPDSNSYLYDSLSSQNDSLLTRMIRDDQQRVFNDSIAFQLHTAAMKQQALLNDTKQDEHPSTKDNLNSDEKADKASRATSKSLAVRLNNLNVQTGALNIQQALRIDALRTNYKSGTSTYGCYPDPASPATNNMKPYEVPQSYSRYVTPIYSKGNSFDEETNMAGLVDALKTAGIIQTKDDVQSFKLSDTEFILNDNKMPDDIYLPLRKAFVPETKANHHWAWMYNFKTS